MESENYSKNQPENPSNFQKPPKTWLVESILVTLFCCLPFGIAGIIYAAKVESTFYAGRINESERASHEAGKWTKIGFWIAIAGWILYFVFAVVLGVMSAFWE